ncbi:hypothetical protein GC176_22700 [bacterium]|nr:hypothetical protein [bacterium]
MRFRLLTGNRINRWSRSGLVGLTLIGFAIGTVGIPVPVSVVESSNTGQFICQGHGCGCQTAANCWKSCCCFSPKKRLEWAAKNQVQVSDTLADHLRRDAADDERSAVCASPSLVTEVVSAGLRSTEPQRELTQSSPTLGGGSLTAAESPLSDSKKRRGKRDGVTWYSVILARKCQGVGSTLLLISDPLSVPALRDDWQVPENVQRLAPESEPLLCSLVWTPPVPPG